MTDMTFAVVAGDNEPNPATAKLWAEWHRALGYTTVLASSKPTDQLATAYEGVEADVITSVDSLLPYKPGHKPLHRRIAFAVRMGGLARAFHMTNAEAVVLMDSDGLMLCRPAQLEILLEGFEAYVQELPFPREEARAGWVTDIGAFILTRQGFRRLMKLAEMSLDWLDELGDEVSVHGILAAALRRCGIDCREQTLGGVYLTPMGEQKVHLDGEMGEDTWLNSGHVLFGNEGTPQQLPLFMHNDRKTRFQLGDEVSDELFMTWQAQAAALKYGLPYKVLTPLAFSNVDRKWKNTYKKVTATLQAHGFAAPVQTFHHDWAAMQAKAVELEGGEPAKVPPYNLGVAAEITHEQLKEILW